MKSCLRAEHYDESDEWPWEIFHKAREVGLVNVNVPEEFGGIGASALEESVISEAFAYGCSGIQTALMLNQLAILPLLVAGTEEQKQRYLPWIIDDGKVAAYCMTEPDAGSDVAGIKSTALRRGDAYLLNGSKTWITDGPVASLFAVFRQDGSGGGPQWHELLHCRAGLAGRQRRQALEEDGPARGPGPAKSSLKMSKCRWKTGLGKRAMAFGLA